MRLFHVSSTRNRLSIERHGLDWQRMGAARGIAGSTEPEVEGVFVCDNEFDSEFFVRMNNTGGPVDVWGVDVDDDTWTEALEADGFRYLPFTLAADRLTLVRHDVVSQDPGPDDDHSEVLHTTLTITWDDE